MKVAALAGGVGGAKLLVGLQSVLANDLTAIVNTGDDALIYGVEVAPDIDIVTYWLAGIADTRRGWGIAGDSFEVVSALERLGEDPWFRLGDRDFATCLHRTQGMRSGMKLSEVTEDIRTRLGVAAVIRPMSDSPVRTRVVAADGSELEFQEYFVREATRPEVTSIRFEGIEQAAAGPGVLDALAEAERIILCPSNPFVSIGPIVALPGVRDALRAHPHVIAVSPIVRGAALRGPADRMLASLRGREGAAAVAELYRDFCDVFVVDRADVLEADAIEGLGVRAAATDTVMHDDADSRRLAECLLRL